MKKRWKILISCLVALVVVISGGLWWLNRQIYQPTAVAEENTAEAQKVADGWYFPGSEDKPVVIFYQGALVEAGSYSGWAKELAAAGYGVYLLQTPFSLPVLAGDQAGAILKQQAQRDYILGGHSLGGVMASRFAEKQLAKKDRHLKGIFFLASYPDEKGRLDHSNLPVLSVTASQDKVLNWQNYQKAKKYLPAGTVYQEIPGGNHGGFGDYGQQKGDGEAEITPEEQNRQVADELKKWLASL